MWPTCMWPALALEGLGHPIDSACGHVATPTLNTTMFTC